MLDVKFVESWSCPATVKGFVLDNDGCLIASREINLDAFLSALLRYGPGTAFDQETMGELAGLMHQSESSMCQFARVFLLSRYPNGLIQRIPKGSFGYRFANRRALELSAAVRNGRVKIKEGAEALLAHLREARYFSAMFTDTPLAIAEQTVGPVLNADDMFHGITLLTCDDRRLLDQPKSSPHGWNVLGVQAGLEPRQMVAVEDAAEGAVGALCAHYGAVIVVPGADASVSEWDGDCMMSAHLRRHPQDREKLVFLRSLSDIRFA